MKAKVIWHWWHRGKRIRPHKDLQTGIRDILILNVRYDHKGRLLYDAEVIRT